MKNCYKIKHQLCTPSLVTFVDLEIIFKNVAVQLKGSKTVSIANDLAKTLRNLTAL